MLSKKPMEAIIFLLNSFKHKTGIHDAPVDAIFNKIDGKASIFTSGLIGSLADSYQFLIGDIMKNNEQGFLAEKLTIAYQFHVEEYSIS